MTGYSETEVSDGPSRWVARKPHLFQPQAVTQLLTDLHAVTDAELKPNEKVSKIRENTHGGARLRCIEIQRQNMMPSMSEKSLCFDESTGALGRIVDRGDCP